MEEEEEEEGLGDPGRLRLRQGDRSRGLGLMLQATTERREGGGGGGEHGYAAILAHAEGVLYGTELGSVTLLYGTELGSVTLKRFGLFCFPNKHSTHTLQESWCRSARSSGCSSIEHFLMPVRQVQSCSCNRDSSLLLVYLAPNTRARTHTRRDGF